MDNQEEEMDLELDKRLAELDAIYKRRKRNIIILMILFFLGITLAPVAYLWNIKRVDTQEQKAIKATEEKIKYKNANDTMEMQLDQAIETITGQDAKQGTTAEKLKTLEIFIKQKCPEIAMGSDGTEHVCPPCDSCCPELESAVVEKPCPPTEHSGLCKKGYKCYDPNVQCIAECSVINNCLAITPYVEAVQTRIDYDSEQISYLKSQVADLRDSIKTLLGSN